MLFWGIWAPPNIPQKVNRGPQVGRMYVPMFKLESRPLTISLGPFFKEKVIRSNQKIRFCAVLGHLGTSKWTEKVHKGPQVGWTYGPKYKLQNGPLTKSLVPFLWEK
jgi:hypothetical protein